MTRYRTLLIAAIFSTLISGANAQVATTFSGKAAYYDVNYKGATASGKPYDAKKFTAAHRTLPMGTKVRVTDLKTGRSTVVVINDRGPFNKGRVIDLSLAAAKAIGMIERGVISIGAEILKGPESR